MTISLISVNLLSFLKGIMPISKNQKNNSQALKERFFDFYQDFFAGHDMVVSGSYYAHIIPSMGWRAGAPTISIKLPLRAYLSVTITGKVGEIEIGEQKVYDTCDDSIKDSDFDYLDFEKTLPFLKKYIQEISGEKEIPGFRFDIYCEMSESRGINTGIANLFALAMRVYFGYIPAEGIPAMTRVSAEELYNQSTKEAKWFRQISVDASKIRSTSLFGSSAGMSDYISMIESEFPLVYFTQERAGSVESPVQNLPPLLLEGHEDRFEDAKYWGFRLNELSDIKGSIPLDITSIFPGSHTEFRASSEHIRHVVIPGFDKLRDKAKGLFKDILDEDKKHLPCFLKNINEDGAYFQEYMRAKSYAKLSFIFGLIELYKNKLDRGAINKVIDLMRSMSNMGAVFRGLPSKSIRLFERKIEDYAEKAGVNIGMRARYWQYQNGDIILIAPRRRFRDQLESCIEELQKIENPKIHIDYASWRDGFGKEGAKIDQFISHGIYSEFIDKNSKKLRMSENCEVSTSIVTDIDPAKFDLFLDSIANKLYVGGEVASSKQIPSQKAAIEILAYLFDRMGGRVANKTLPKQTYSSYRNEFQGKIITPLSKLLKEKTGKQLGIDISGQLIAFDVIFDPKELTIGILEEI